jgi:hypothetical protein
MTRTLALVAALLLSSAANAATFSFSSTSTFAAQVPSALASGDTISLPTDASINIGTSVDLTGYSNLVIIVNKSLVINGNNNKLQLSGSSVLRLMNTFSSIVVGTHPNNSLRIGGNTVASDGTTTTGVGTFTATGFAAGSITPLPVTLVSFKAAISQGLVKLSFEVANEKNISYYEVERSTDGKSFIKTGVITNSRNAENGYAYTVEDTKAAAGTNYYRLSIHSTDGSIANSPTTTARLANSQSFEPTIFPNPAANLINITTNNAIEYAIVDMAGHTALRGTSTQIDISSLQKGTYVLKMTSNGQSSAVSFLKIAD